MDALTQMQSGPSALSEAGSSVYQIAESEKGEIQGKEAIAPNAPNAPNSCRLVLVVTIHMYV